MYNISAIQSNGEESWSRITQVTQELANLHIFIIQVSNSLKLLQKYLVYNCSSENLLKTILYYLVIDKS